MDSSVAAFDTSDARLLLQAGQGWADCDEGAKESRLARAREEERMLLLLQRIAEREVEQSGRRRRKHNSSVGS